MLINTDLNWRGNGQSAHRPSQPGAFRVVQMFRIPPAMTNSLGERAFAAAIRQRV
jgi:hypothetical protein